jgi:serine/threonine protein kinase
VNLLKNSMACRKLCLVCNAEFTDELAVCPSDGSPLAVTMNPAVSADVVPGYQLLRQIGQGASGIVYQAIHIATGRWAAIKILRFSLLNNLEMVQRFKKEAALTSQLSSPHIVTVKEFGLVHDGRPYMVMDYINGCCLSTIIQQAPVPPKRALSIFMQVSTGLAAAHEKGIIHRDIKSSNIMVLNEPGAIDMTKIVDFGIAKEYNENGNNSPGGLTLNGNAVGSPSHMSPEQCAGSKLDPRTDIYSLGCVMYETLTGRQVFQGQTAQAVMIKHINEAPAPMLLPKSAVSDELEYIVFKAMSKSPQDRYGNVHTLKSDLQFCLNFSASRNSTHGLR